VRIVVVLAVAVVACGTPPPATVVITRPIAHLSLESGTLSLSGHIEGTSGRSVSCRLDGGPPAELRVGPFGEFGALVNAGEGSHELACSAGGPAARVRFDMDAFVRVRGGELTVNGQPFRFVGVNAYYLHEEATRELQGRAAAQGRLDEVFARAADMGATVVRTWAFNDDPESGTVIQPAPLVYESIGLEGLDRVIASARAHGIRLVLPLANYWADYGGVQQYLRWHGLPPGQPQRFFTDPEVRAHFRAHITELLSRRNSVTGVLYRDDPTILAWELMNEPRGIGLDREGLELSRWIAEMARTVRKVDPNHLVGTGEEGFDSVGSLSEPYWRRLGARELVAPTAGTDFLADTAAVDFASVHVYPEAWGVAPPRIAEAGERWIEEHARIAAQLGKPLIVGEFGLKNREIVLPADARRLGAGAFSYPERRAIYDRWLGTSGADPDVAGVLSWVLMHDGRVDAFSDVYAWTWVSGHPAELPGSRYAELYREYAALFAGGFM
jgi:mannan endo-1,4-beta-mannosidase